MLVAVIGCDRGVWYVRHTADDLDDAREHFVLQCCSLEIFLRLVSMVHMQSCASVMQQLNAPLYPAEVAGLTEGMKY